MTWIVDPMADFYGVTARALDWILAAHMGGYYLECGRNTDTLSPRELLTAIMAHPRCRA